MGNDGELIKFWPKNSFFHSFSPVGQWDDGIMCSFLHLGHEPGEVHQGTVGKLFVALWPEGHDLVLGRDEPAHRVQPEAGVVTQAVAEIQLVSTGRVLEKN